MELHVVPGRVLRAQDLISSAPLPTLLGQNLTVLHHPFLLHAAALPCTLGVPKPWNTHVQDGA